MPIDADFGRIALSAKKYESVLYPSDVRRIIELAQIQNPFEIVYVNNNLTDDLCNDGTTVLDVKDFKTSLESLFQPSRRANLNLLTGWEVEFTTHLKSVINYTGRFPEAKRENDLFFENVTSEVLKNKIMSAPSAYDDFLPIPVAKLKNIEELTKYVVQKHGLEFYKTIYAVVGDQRKYLHVEWSGN
ncbi:unnamed protein product [Allacma fusca]|uniref:Uncharacterized protein n=1 Tax=Allacma fusca TaxID=39272 RepID=A0A8J2PGJ1_9HEXA|nr:unnamed protein product [Allacma fusca]